MKNQKNSKKLNAIRVVSKNNQVFVKSNTELNEWYPINFQWIPVIQLNKSLNP
ncbi:hypothetical protein VOI54_14030 [Tamlana sp. 2201CG12-4]|uniref:hypothetical protein n=1 Tax=Tamlana sp. 2201CG12-4 TaxID=3112582 RepID=UPI002DB82404|nr:hypothetical protein [Tamlana sp. 2201CG12-4]MEC3908145.1 hypothetical protein [Tamlana sp. 2201CG12-4]